MSLQALKEYTFNTKYARYLPEKKRRETWSESVTRVKEMHLRKYPQIKEEIEWAFKHVESKRVLGSQRALQFGGKAIEKKNARIYNCFSQETSFITKNGVKTFADFNDGDVIEVLTHDGTWKSATVNSHGIQKLNAVTLKKGSSSPVVKYATENHTWLLKNGERTTKLSEGDQLHRQPNIFNDWDYDKASPEEKMYWAYGLVYGDGSKLKSEGEYKYSMIRLCGEDKKYASRFEELGFKTSTSDSLNGDFYAYTGTYLKTLPNPEVESIEKLRAFVRGLLDADGTKSKNYPKNKTGSMFLSIQQSNIEAQNFIRKVFPIVGAYIISEVELTHDTNYGTQDAISFRVSTACEDSSPIWKVEHIEENVREEVVWCLNVEENHSFVMPEGIVTGNCIASYCDRVRFFQECFWLLLCGCGTGFSVQKHHIAKLPDFSPSWLDKDKENPTRIHVIEDSIEGWADAIGILMTSYLGEGDFSDIGKGDFTKYEGYRVEFDYSLIRPEGSLLGSSSGKAPGPEPLRLAIEKVRGLIDSCIERGQSRLRTIDAYDIIMHASDAVLSGGVRRSATICLFSPDDKDMATAKIGNWFQENPQRGRSNNSALLIRDKTTKEEFETLMSYVREFGEPGFVWSDSTELLVNPCVEIGLYPVDVETGKSGWEACNLCEINGAKCKTPEDFALACEAGAIIGTCQAGYTDLTYLGETSKRILEKEALLGISITGMMDNPDILFDPELQKKNAKLILRVNERIAKKIGINPAARATAIKPAGTTSCMLGTASGIHPHHAKRYIRRSQGNYLEPPLQYFKSINPIAVEPSVWSANGTDEVVAFCVEVPKGAKTKNDIDALALLEYVKSTQQNWIMEGMVKERCTADWLAHNVSNTITVKPDEWESVTDYIYDNRDYFAGVSLLPITGDKDYPQAPFSAIYTPTELVRMYGDASVFASGLIVDGLHAFKDNLWAACDAVLGAGEPVEVEVHEFDLSGMSVEEAKKITEESKANLTIEKGIDPKKDWVRRAKQFAERHFDGDIKHMTYCLKDVNNWHYWCNLQREYKDVDFSNMLEESDTTVLEQTIACSNGQCELTYA